MDSAYGHFRRYCPAAREQINDELVIRGLDLGFLDMLAKEYADLALLRMRKFELDDKSKTYNLRKDRKFETHIPLELRVQVLRDVPPKAFGTLESIAERAGADRWRITKGGQ